MRLLVLRAWPFAMMFGMLGIITLAPVLWMERDVIRASELAPTAFASTMGRVVDHDVGYTYFTKRRHYQPRVIYFFTAGGRQYRGDRMNLRIRESFSSPARAEREMSGLPIGTSVRVYYDPTDPSLSTLDTAADFQGYYRFMVVLFCLSSVVAVVCFLGYWPLKRWATGTGRPLPEEAADGPERANARLVATFAVVSMLVYFTSFLVLVTWLGFTPDVWRNVNLVLLGAVGVVLALRFRMAR